MKKIWPLIPDSLIVGEGGPIPNIVLSDDLGHPFTDCLVVRGFLLEVTLLPTSLVHVGPFRLKGLEPD